MAKIDTSITTGSISSINKTPSVSVGSGGRVIDSNAQILAKTLSSVNSALGDYVVKKEKEKATEQTLEGANAINGVTLEEAKELHKASREFGGGYVGLRAKGSFKNKEKSGFYGAWIEVGNQAKSKTYKWGPAKPFIGPAYKATKSLLMNNMLIDARKVMYKQIKKVRKEGTAAYK